MSKKRVGKCIQMTNLSTENPFVGACPVSNGIYTNLVDNAFYLVLYSTTTYFEN